MLKKYMNWLAQIYADKNKIFFDLNEILLKQGLTAVYSSLVPPGPNTPGGTSGRSHWVLPAGD